jgi:hypothetical protein
MVQSILQDDLIQVVLTKYCGYALLITKELHMFRPTTLIVILFSITSLTQNVAQAQNNSTPESHTLSQEEMNYYNIAKSKIEEIPDQSPLKSKVQIIQFDKPVPIPMPQSSASLNGVSIETIINIGKQVWTIIEAGKPVSSFQQNSASAMPQGVTYWNQLAGWKPSQSKSYQISYENFYGFEVINYKYRLLFTYGGNLNGLGRYITNATVLPADISVAWGFTLNSQVSIPTVVNVGSMQNPIGGMQINVNWSISNPIMNKQQTVSFFIDGTGQVKTLN